MLVICDFLLMSIHFILMLLCVSCGFGCLICFIGLRFRWVPLFWACFGPVVEVWVLLFARIMVGWFGFVCWFGAGFSG